MSTVKVSSTSFLVIFIFISLSGCERQPYTKATIVESGYLTTPKGKYRFKNINLSEAKKLKLKDHDRLYGSYLVAEGEHLTFSYCSACMLEKITIILPSERNTKDWLLTILDKDAQYKLGNTPYKPMLYNKNRVQGEPFNIEYNLKRDRLPIYVIGPGLTDGEVGHINFSFKINNDQYHVNLGLSVETAHRLKLSIGIPATP
jgi:hypothetical protein